MRQFIMFFSLIASLIWLAGCGGHISNANVEKAVQERAAGFIGPAEKFSVIANDCQDRTIGQVKITAIGVKPDPSQVIDPLTLTLKDIAFQAQPFHLSSIGSALFTGRVSEASVNSYLQGQGRTGNGTVKNIRVSFVANSIQVTAAVAVYGVDIAISTAGRFRVENGLRILYAPRTLKVAGIGVPPLIKEMIAERVNPLVDLSGLRFAPQIEAVTIAPGELLFNGKATLRTLD